MKTLWNIFFKTFVVEYYRLNAGLLFVVVMFAGGFLRLPDHIILATYSVVSPLLLFAFFSFWMVYHLKTIFFIRQRLLWDNHQFIYHFRLVPAYQRYALWYFTQFFVWLPVVAYALFMVWCGLKIGAENGVMATLLYILLLPISGVLAYEYRLKRPNPDYKINQISTYFNRKFKKPVWSFFLFYLLKKEPVLFLTTKITVFILLGLCRLYSTDTYDERLISLAGLFVALGHIVMILHLHQFEELNLPILRNLPISISKRFLNYSILFVFLLLPETLILIRNFPEGLNFWYFAQWIFAMTGTLWLFFARTLIKPYDMDLVLRHGFWILIAGFFIIMFKTPLWLIALSCWAAASWWFRKYYQL